MPVPKGVIARSGSDEAISTLFHGLVILRSDQCPYFEDATQSLLALAKKKGIPSRGIELKTSKEIRKLAPSPYGVYSVVLDGRVIPSHYEAREALQKHSGGKRK